MTAGSPKLTGADTTICWLKRRIQPLRYNGRLMCTYTGESTDPLRIGEDLQPDDLSFRLHQLISNRTQTEESFPMFCTANLAPEVILLRMEFTLIAHISILNTNC